MSARTRKTHNRAWGQTLSKKRQIGQRQPRRRFLIVCEGEKTEPNYFRAFPVEADVKIVGAGRGPKGVLSEAQTHARRAKQDGEPYDEIWCVFDRDDTNEDDFNRFVYEASQLGGVAYSNEAFELWYCLHFDFIDTRLTRQDYIQKLKAKLGDYRKNDIELYKKLLPYQPTALANAGRLEANYPESTPPTERNPCTTVHHLVQRLNEHRRP